MIPVDPSVFAALVARALGLLTIAGAVVAMLGLALLRRGVRYFANRRARG